MKNDYDFCISSYLAFRYVAKPGIAWKEGIVPEFPNVKTQGRYKVKNSADVLERLRQIIQHASKMEELGILLSAGIDSATIAAMLPRGSHAYTIRFMAKDAINEAPQAQRVAEKLGLKHSVVTVTWKDYTDSMDILMKRKKAPLHPAEVGLYKAACIAHKDGINTLLVGNGADTTFGGMDKLLSKDWTFDEFVARYTFLNPPDAVKRPVSVCDIYKPFRWRDGFNVVGFLKVVHGLGIFQMFENAIHAAGCSLLAPFEELALDVPLDLPRIRAGEPKYILNDVFRAVLPNFEISAKIPFARPMKQWLIDWSGPRRLEFLESLSITGLNGEQKWQLYCLEKFLNMLEKGII